MKLATLKNGKPDGQLVVVSADLTQYVSAGRIAPTLQAALDAWDEAAPRLAELSARLNAGDISTLPFVAPEALAPLPRAYQWIDCAAYLNHLERVRSLKGSKDAEFQTVRPLMYQGASDSLSGPRAPIRAPESGLAVDFEAEIAVILGPVPMRPDTATAAGAIRLLALCNDVSFRRLVLDDLQNGFGFFHSKPSTAFAPVFVTPDELGPAWRDRKCHLRVHIEINGRLFGQPDSGVDMDFDFADLIAAAANTRSLGCGTILGAGTISNRHDDVPPIGRDGIGFGCIAEARTVEKAKFGTARTPFLVQGDSVHIDARDRDGNTVFGSIKQMVEIGR